MSVLRLQQFDVNIGRARELVGLGQSLAGMTYGRVDATDMYRAALVQAVAALDSYVHGMVLDYGVEILTGRRSAGSRTQLGLHFGAISDIVRASSPTDLELSARAHIAERLGRETFQQPDDVAKAFAMVGVNRLWSSAFGVTAGNVCTSLKLIVRRRNQIVHSCDADPLNPGHVTAMTDADALTAVSTIEKIVKAVDSVS